MALVTHQCDERCVCPIHDIPLFYWTAGDSHACQNVECVHGHGVMSDHR
jgi:hypothetical protein